MGTNKDPSACQDQAKKTLQRRLGTVGTVSEDTGRLIEPYHLLPSEALPPYLDDIARTYGDAIMELHDTIKKLEDEESIRISQIHDDLRKATSKKEMTKIRDDIDDRIRRARDSFATDPRVIIYEKYKSTIHEKLRPIIDKIMRDEDKQRELMGEYIKDLSKCLGTTPDAIYKKYGASAQR